MKLKIVTKINLFITLLIIITSVFLGIFFIKHETKSIEIELDERANTIAHYLAYNSEYGVLVGDKDILNRLLQGIIKEKNISYAIIENKQGKIIAQAGKKTTEYIKEFTTPIIAKPLSKEINELDIIPHKKKEIKKEIIGKVKLGVSLFDLHKKSYQIQKVILSIIFMVILISAIIVFLIIRFLIHHPLNKLISGTEKIGGGDLSYRVNINTNDEIGILANSFNKMAETLQIDINKIKITKRIT